MTTLCQRESTIVDRVRIRSRYGDRLAAQQKIGHLLGHAELRPSALPPAAILIVRRLHGQEPRTGWLDDHRIYLPPEWQEAATRELDRFMAQAARPALTPVPSSADAVLFADHAELLACLALDWLRGTLRTNWWWSTFLKHGTPEVSLCREWTQSPEFLPAAFEILAARRCADEFLRRLPHTVVLSLLDSVLARFAVPHLVQPGANPEPSALSEEEPLAKPAVEPWLPLVPEASAPDLTPAKRILLAQALMLRRAPACARAISFQQQLAHCRAWEERAHEPRPEEGPAEAGETIPSTASYAPRPASDERSNTIPMAADRIPQFQTHQGSSAQRDEFPNIDMPDVSAPETHAVEPMAHERTIEASSLPAPTHIQTALGGIFFLLNVALHLKLYADFTSPGGVNLELDIWDFLYLLGERFVSPERHNDPVFHLLAELACRTGGQQPGQHFQPPESWRVPREWLDAFPEPFAPQEVIDEGRRLLSHPAGFLLADEPYDSTTQLTEPLLRWLNWIAAYTEARLARALGREDAARFLCSIPARVYFTPSHLDVVYPLDVYPIEIRTAGLDRDPGWIPAAGRFVAFHFE